MQIELSLEDIELISLALESHERIGISENIASEMMRAVVLGKESMDAQFVAERELRMKKVDFEARQRKSKSLMLRARLAEMSTRSAEFST